MATRRSIIGRKGTVFIWFSSVFNLGYTVFWLRLGRGLARRGARAERGNELKDALWNIRPSPRDRTEKAQTNAMAALSAPALPMIEPHEGDDASVQSSEVDSNQRERRP